MAFPFLKIRYAVGSCRMFFPLSPVWDGTSCRHVAMSACRDDVMSAYVPTWNVQPFPCGLVEVCKNVEPLRMDGNTLKHCVIHIQLILNKHIMHNKRQRKRKSDGRTGYCNVSSSSSVWRCWFSVEPVFLLYINIILYLFNNSTEYQRLSSSTFCHSVIPAHVFTGMIASVTAIHVGGIGKPVGCR